MTYRLAGTARLCAPPTRRARLAVGTYAAIVGAGVAFAAACPALARAPSSRAWAAGAGPAVTMGPPAATFTAAPGSPFLVGGDPFALATWPGHLAVSNPSSGTIAAFSFGADGRLALAPDSPLAAGGSAPSGVAAFATEQGREIVVAADTSSNAVSVFSDAGSGRLAPLPGSPVPSGEPAPSIVAALRGKFVAVAGSQSGSITVLAWTGSGLTGPIGPPLPTGLTSIRAVAVGDFNGDGKPDLGVVGASAGSARNISILLGNGSGGFMLAPGSPFSIAGGSPAAVALEDFNDDGNADLAITDTASNAVSVLFGNGDGSFRLAPGSPFPSGGSIPSGVVSADLNGDGLADLAVINSGSGSLAVFRGDGTGRFAAQPQFPTWIGGAAPSAIVSIDVNADSHPDLVVANRESQTIQVLLNTTVPAPVEVLRSQLRNNGIVRLTLKAPAAGTFSGSLLGAAPRTHQVIRYGLVDVIASRPGSVVANVAPTRQGTRLFKAVSVLRLQTKIGFTRRPLPSFSDAVVPLVASGGVRRPVVPRHHARRVVVHV